MPFTELAELATMVVAGTTPENIQVLIPDCTEPPVSDEVIVDLCHVVELFMGNPFGMGTELYPPPRPGCGYMPGFASADPDLGTAGLLG